MPRGVWLSNAAAKDLEFIREWLTQPGSGAPAAAKLADLLESLAELPETATRYPIDPDRPSHRYLAQHGYWIRFRIGSDVIFVSRLFGPGQNRR
jgi:plasmid stabilization system protein ParE